MISDADKMRLTKWQRPFFPTNKEHPNDTSKERHIGATSAVKVKTEKANDGADEDEDEAEDEDGDDDARHGNAARLAKRIYKKALKILKLKLYFENFFPTDVEKDSLPYSCWTTAVASSGEIDGGSAAACRMFYEDRKSVV